MYQLVIGELVGTHFCWHLKRHVFLVTGKYFFYWYGTFRAFADINAKVSRVRFEQRPQTWKLSTRQKRCDSSLWYYLSVTRTQQ